MLLDPIANLQFPTAPPAPLPIIGALQSAIFNSANFSCIATDAKGVIQIFNIGAERMLGYNAADVVNRITPADISDPDELIGRAHALSAELGTPIAPGFDALAYKASHAIEDIYELTYVRKDGTRFAAVVSVTALRDPKEGVIGFLLIGTDNTARKAMEVDQQKLGQRLRDLQFYTRSLFESNIDALLTTDPDGIITDVNKQMEALTGSTRDELIGAPFKDCFTERLRAQDAIRMALSTKKLTNYELTARQRGGSVTVVSCNVTTFYDRERTLLGVFAAVRDITERKRAEQEILDLALHDALTHLPNRRLLTDRLSLMAAASKRSGRCGALMFMDIDRLKPLNDLYGHQAGDQLLIEVARRIGACVREIDFVARFGGDEFVVILSELDAQRVESTRQAAAVAEKIRATLAQPYSLVLQTPDREPLSVQYHCSASLGAVVFFDDDVSQDLLLKWADAQMYVSKEAGGDRVSFQPDP
jgi:diguanylate cyclase (GGDEF)-like protein/PAS domain S-box-containing protein